MRKKIYYEPVWVDNFCSNNYIEYESSSDGYKTLWIEEYLNKIRTYLKGNTNNLKKSDTWKKMAAKFMSSKDIDEELTKQIKLLKKLSTSFKISSWYRNNKER